MGFRKPGTQVLAAHAKMRIDPDQFTLADTFKAAGYTTGVIGKWHLGLSGAKSPINWNGDVKPGPLELGFDESFLLPSNNDRDPTVYLDGDSVPKLDPNDPITVSYDSPIPPEVPATRCADGQLTPEAMAYYPCTQSHNNSLINSIGWMIGGKAALCNDEDIADTLMERTRQFIANLKHGSRPRLLHLGQDIRERNNLAKQHP